MKNRNVKIVLTFIIMISSIAGIVGTICFAKTQANSNMPNGININRPSLPNNSSSNSNSTNDSSNSSSTNDSSSTNSNQATNTPPNMPNDSMGSGMGRGNFSGRGDLKNNSYLNVGETGIIAICSIVFLFSLTYVIKSKMLKLENKDIFVNKDRIVIYLLINILGSILLTTGIVCAANNLLLNKTNMDKPTANITNNNSNSNSATDNATNNNTSTTTS